MPHIVLVIVKYALMAASLAAMKKAVFWFFDIDSRFYERKEKIGWLEGVIKRPSLLLRPIRNISVLLLVVFFIYWVSTSPNRFAVQTTNIWLHVWPFVKWSLITITVIGMNRFHFSLFFPGEYKGAREGINKNEKEASAIRKILGVVGSDIREHFQIFYILLGLFSFILLNSLFALGIYYQL